MSADRRARQAVIEQEFAEDQQAVLVPAPIQDAVLARVASHTRAERAIVGGEWPFVCPYCGDTFQTDRGSFPYCGTMCAINAQND